MLGISSPPSQVAFDLFQSLGPCSPFPSLHEIYHVPIDYNFYLLIFLSIIHYYPPSFPKPYSYQLNYLPQLLNLPEFSHYSVMMRPNFKV